MSKQASIYNFFSKSQASKKLNSGEKARNNVKLKGTSVGEHDLVWAKLEGYPWWPALVCHSPSENVFLKNNKIHVQFFDDPPTRGWVKEMLVKAYCPVGENGIPSYKDPMWIKAVKEANKAKTMDKKERGSLIVQMVPSDEEEEEEDVVAMETDDDKDDDDDSDRSKENIGVNGTKNKRRKKGTENSDGGEPLKKRRRIILCSDSESEDDYKPGKESESEDDSGSSGVDEDQVSGLETESEVDSPVKTPKTKSKRPVVVASSELKSLTSSPSSSATRAPSTPKVSSATKSSLAAFAAKDAAPSSNTGEGGGEDWPFLHYPWLLPENIRDRNQRRPDHPDYNKRTLYVPDTFLNKQTPGMRQWWELKSCHNDTVLFFKMGKFYELFHMDALLGVQELGLLMMKGDNAHAGFPEIAYGRYSATLIDKGYKVARIEQTETPEMMEKRCKSMARASKFDRVVRREVCQVTTKATRVYSFLDGEDAQAATSHLLALTERSTSGAVEGCEFGVAFVDTSTGLFHLGQFVDDRHLSRLRTLLAHYPADQILVERGKLSQKTNTLVNATVSPGLKEVLTPEKEFWGAGKTLSFLADGPYFHSDPRESESRGEDDKERETKGKKDKGKSGGVNWPEELKLMLDDGDVLELTARGDCELAVSSLGGLIWYLQECHLDEQLLTRRMMSRYQPQDNALLATTPESPPKNNRSPATTRHYMVLDGITLRNLEVFENSSGGTEGTLMDRLDRCSTPFGKRTPAVKEWLEDRHKEGRLRFAQQYVGETMDFLGRVIFTDEKTFSSTRHGRLHCWRPNNTRFEAEHIFQEARSGHVTANVWGWINLNSVGELTDIEGRFTADKYLEIMEEVMLPTVRAYTLPFPEKIVFMQDRCPVHTARVVTQWFNEHRDQIELLDWPSKACDLNPIETVWATMVNSWEPERERTRRQLLNHTMAEWEALRKKPHLVTNFISSMPRRLSEVVEQQGNWTSY